jgi:hypothetical protein
MFCLVIIRNRCAEVDLLELVVESRKSDLTLHKSRRVVMILLHVKMSTCSSHNTFRTATSF